MNMLKTNQKLYRHEKKYLISDWEKHAMLNRLGAFLKRDANGSEKGYTIRSLYFDDYHYSSYDS